MPASRIYNPFVGSGGGGGGGVTPAQLADAEEIVTKEFSFLDTSLLIFNIPANAKIVVKGAFYLLSAMKGGGEHEH